MFRDNKDIYKGKLADSIAAKNGLYKVYVPSLEQHMSLLYIRYEEGFAYGAMGRRIDPSWGGPIELFLVPASAPRLV